VAHGTLRQAIQTWQQRLELTGMGLVETALAQGPKRDDGSCSSTTLNASIDATLAHLARLTPSQFTVELSYPWGREDGRVGGMLGLISKPADESSESWSQADAA